MTRRFDHAPTPLAGLVVVCRKPIWDERGYFERMYCSDELRAAGLVEPIVQMNRTLTRRAGVVRGLHFQESPFSESKLVSCLRGSVFDVAVDLRATSRSLLQWYGIELSEENRRSLLIPPGFAHGFQTLTDNCEMLYQHTAPYVPEAENAINAFDPSVQIQWPLQVTEMSDRDQNHPMLAEDFGGIQV